MSAEETKVSALDRKTTPATNDDLYAVDNSTDSPTSKVISIASLATLIGGSGGGISEEDLQTALANYLPTRLGVQTAFLNMGGQQVTNMAEPTLGSSATTKTYVDNAISAIPAGITSFSGIRTHVTPISSNSRNLGSPGSVWARIYGNRTFHSITTINPVQTNVPGIGVRDVFTVNFSNHADIIRIGTTTDPFLIRGTGYVPGRKICLEITNGRASRIELHDNATGGIDGTGWHFSTRGVSGASSQTSAYRLDAGETLGCLLVTTGSTAASVLFGRLT